MTIDEDFKANLPVRTLPALSWEDAILIMVGQDAAILINWRRRAYETEQRIAAKTDVHANYHN